jgi:hypothetical protein
MKIGSFEFNLRELAGSLGDFGTLLPLAIGYITVCKLNPAGLLVMMGLVNIATGLVYRLPMPVEPMKVLAVVAIAQAWTPEKVYTSGMVMGAVWLAMGATGAMDFVARRPSSLSCCCERTATPRPPSSWSSAGSSSWPCGASWPK